MKKILSLLLIIFIISCSQQGKNITIISGKLVGYDSNPVKNAKIKCSSIGKLNLVTSTIDDDGSFVIKTDHKGYLDVEFTGENHHSAEVPILLSKPEKIELNVQLKSKEYKNNANIQFIDTSSISAKYHVINKWFNEYNKKYNLEKTGEEIFSKIDREHDIETKSLLCFLYMKKFFTTPGDYQNIDLNKAKHILQIIPPSSIVWTMRPNLPTWFWYILPQKDHNIVNAYIERISYENKYPSVKAEAINYLLATAEMEEDSSKIKKFYNRLVKECPRSFRTKDAKFKYDILAPGKRVPTFSVTSIENPDETFTDKTMLGDVYLIGFWATTWGYCRGDCIGQMPYLHEAYDKYKKFGFTILSISLDDSPEAVRMFRQGKWKMPWNHAFLEGKLDNEITKRFNVNGYTPILVDSKGKIIANQNNLREEKLLKTLDNYFRVKSN
ncbi:MAG: redoxin domain-containing protein [bacterium]